MPVEENEVLAEIRDQLEAIKTPNAQEATPDNTWSELDVDSLDLVELVKALEDRFEIVISDGDLKPIESIGDAIRLTTRKVETADKVVAAIQSKVGRKVVRSQALESLPSDLVHTLESRFGVKIAEDKLEAIKTVGDLVNLMVALIDEKVEGGAVAA